MYFVVDFENLFRGLSQTGGLNGVEVVMSMEELPQSGTIALGTVVAGAPPGAVVGVPQEAHVGEGKHYLPTQYNSF